MFPLTGFDILLLKGRLVLSHSQWGIESKKIKFSVKNQKKCLPFVEIA